MNVIIKFPQSENGMKAFYERLAKAKVQLVKDYILELPVSSKRKFDLFEQFKAEVKMKSEREQLESKKNITGTQ